MNRPGTRLALVLALLGAARPDAGAAEPGEARARLESTLRTMLVSAAPGQLALATVWDSNAYVQCRRAPRQPVRCEAAGTLMQPSLARVLTPERIDRLGALGWRLDPSFGNYVLGFPPRTPAGRMADLLLATLIEGYGATVATLELRNSWVTDEPCPPRNGMSQNLAGMINDSPEMKAVSLRACRYDPPAEPPAGPTADPPGEALAPHQPAVPTAELIRRLGPGVAREIHRLRVNLGGPRVFTVLETGRGYVQCEPETTPPAIYCEAQSAESWPALAATLTPDRVARLAAAGFESPGLRQNYWRSYPAAQFDDATIADALLRILHDVYGYDGTPALTVQTEKERRALL